MKKCSTLLVILAVALVSVAPCLCASSEATEGHRHECCDDGWRAVEKSCCDESTEDLSATAVTSLVVTAVTATSSPSGVPVASVPHAVPATSFAPTPSWSCGSDPPLSGPAPSARRLVVSLERCPSRCGRVRARGPLSVLRGAAQSHARRRRHEPVQHPGGHQQPEAATLRRAGRSLSGDYRLARLGGSR